jgi:hypothetical protein
MTSVTLHEIGPDIDEAVLGPRVGPAQERYVSGVARTLVDERHGFVPTGEVDSHGEVRLALDLTTGATR